MGIISPWLDLVNFPNSAHPLTTSLSHPRGMKYRSSYFGLIDILKRFMSVNILLWPFVIELEETLSCVMSNWVEKMPVTFLLYFPSKVCKTLTNKLSLLKKITSLKKLSNCHIYLPFSWEICHLNWRFATVNPFLLRCKCNRFLNLKSYWNCR